MSQKHTHPCYKSATWRRVRLFVLHRDGYVCRLKLAGCTTVANTADHIVSLDDGGAWYDPLNLRAACLHCNSVRGAKARHAKTRGDDARLPRAPSRRW